MNYEIKHSIAAFEHIAPYTLRVIFEDKTIREICFKDVLGGELFRPLRKASYFKKVFVSEGIPTLTWPNGADFNPDHLYNWPDYIQQYIDRARRWEALSKTHHS